MSIRPNELITDYLRPYASEKTAQFSAKLAPTIDPGRFLGLKTATLKQTSKALLEAQFPISACEFRAATPHPFVELDIIHVHTLNALKDPDVWTQACEDFLPHIDNWMVTDSFDPILLRGKRTIGSQSAAAVIKTARRWLDGGRCGVDNDDTYTVRAGVLVLLQALHKGHYDPAHLTWVAAVRHADYYVHMACGWYFATAFDKYEADARPFLDEPGHLQLQAHRLAIRKIIESRKTSSVNLTWAKEKRRELKELAAAQSASSPP